MNKSIPEDRVMRRCLPLCLMLVVFLWGCATVDPQSLTKFKQGLSVVRTDSQTILIEFNRFVRELQLDRAATLPNLKESDVAPGLDAESMGRWNAALEALSLYATALESLAAPASAAKVEASLKSLGDRILALDPGKDLAGPGAKEVTQAIGHIGKLIVEGAAKKKALEIALEADPSVRAVLGQMAAMIGADPAGGGLRTTMWSNWTTRAAGFQVAFLERGANKRKIAAAYAESIEGRQATDAALGALRKALLDLADLHTAAAQGRSADASEIIAFLRQEVAFATKLLESAQGAKAKGGTQ
jgi:hypothetical protein